MHLRANGCSGWSVLLLSADSSVAQPEAVEQEEQLDRLQPGSAHKEHGCQLAKHSSEATVQQQGFVAN